MSDKDKTPDDAPATDGVAPATPDDSSEPGIKPEDYDYVGPSELEGYIDNGGGGL